METISQKKTWKSVKHEFWIFLNFVVGGAVASWLIGASGASGPVSSPAGIKQYSVLCSWARHFTLTVSVSLHPAV